MIKLTNILQEIEIKKHKFKLMVHPSYHNEGSSYITIKGYEYIKLILDDWNKNHPNNTNEYADIFSVSIPEWNNWFRNHILYSKYIKECKITFNILKKLTEDTIFQEYVFPDPFNVEEGKEYDIGPLPTYWHGGWDDELDDLVFFNFLKTKGIELIYEPFEKKVFSSLIRE